MNSYYADLHVHLGASSAGTPVKITASKSLTFDAVIEECSKRKGIDMVGIVDCAAPKVIRDIERLAAEDVIYELPEGGFLHRDRLLIIPGSEVEACEGEGRVSHHIGYFPYLKNLKRFSGIMGGHITNMELSSQSSGLPCRALYDIILSCGGIPVPAHAFTPHKSVYGKVTDSIRKIFDPEQILSMPAIELGLSADTDIGDMKSELAGFSFLTSSDAHSAGKIAREYTLFRMERLNFKEFSLALRSEEGRGIAANFGMDPRLGKYHRSFCKKCGKVAELPPPVLKCPACGCDDHRSFITGVLDRMSVIADTMEPVHPPSRPPYVYQIPLDYVPGLSTKGLQRLIDAFGSEMAVIHEATLQELSEVVRPWVAENIIRAREGSLPIGSGGGGKYGHVERDEVRQLRFDMHS